MTLIVAKAEVGSDYLAMPAEYYGVKGASELPKYCIERNRVLVEDGQLLKLAGMEPYTEAEAVGKQPLVGMSETELGHLLT